MTKTQTRVGLVIAAIIVLTVCGTFGTREVVHWVHDSRHREQCQNNLMHLGLAVHDYHSANGHFPPAYVLGKDGKPWHSWRVLLLPYLHRDDLYKRYHFDE